ncbi:outer membrane beta-barrel protein [Lutibacter sp.]|uniref:outer membrane beta-barrel protein n=1 Tax=Lutibacter sp. TaxID=1925666 RepID=UPI002736CC1B|nr:outer membrane beta-barrel protein [Lutibacter sp.]MDP3313219.1 outer membrane beta-barrel protein [Lutibacter sp.]
MKLRNLFLGLVLSLAFINANSQNDFGIKAGLTYNSNGEFKDATETIIDNKGGQKTGYNIGFYGKINLGSIYLRPEFVYTKTTSEYELNSTSVEDYDMSKIDVPVLIGINLLGPLKVFAGPSFQYILDNDINGLTFNKMERDYTIGLNLGASLDFGKFGVDVRYERSFNSNEVEFIDNNIQNRTFTLDSRPEQLIFSLSYSFTNKKKAS